MRRRPQVPHKFKDKLMPQEEAIFAGGCFWCTEAVFGQLTGVHSVVSGYIGGHTVDPTYKEVCGGSTGHAEAIRIAFDAENDLPTLRFENLCLPPKNCLISLIYGKKYNKVL